MSGRCCCDGVRQTRTSRFGRIAEAMGWIVPSATLALIPKCPMCLAAYLALGTGIGISASAAAHLRGGLIFMSLLGLAALVATRLRRLIKRRNGGGGLDRAAGVR